MIAKDRVVVITGAGRGLGRAHALAFAAAGAKVVVNDLGTSDRGDGASATPADEVVAEIRAAGGEAVANHDDIATWDGGASLVRTAVEAFGDLHVVVNNAGIVRDRMFVSSEQAEWDAVYKVHVLGHVSTSRHAAAYWRDRKKAGHPVDARIINTSSGAGLQGSIGQAAYSAAKGAIASLTLVQAAELARYGVTVNAIAPAARTRMTEGVFADMMKKPESGFDAMDPANVSPLLVWLGSAASAGVTGRMFEVQGGRITVFEGWHPGPTIDRGDRWDPAAVDAAVRPLLASARPAAPVYGT
jgi:NAD(P)-dependent dehydrogenase (short-subunit alcohol dehydrogenase family)